HHTYTFEISHNNPLELQNIVLSLQDDGNYKAFLTTYQITNQERIDLYNGVSVDLSQRTSIKEININQVEYANKVGGGCYELEKVGEEWCNHTDHTVEAHILQGGYCNHPTSVYAWVEEPCPGEETGSGSPNVPLNGSDGTLYNNGGNSSADGGTITTSPIALECDNCSNSLSLISNLNLTEQSQIDWVNDSANLIEVNALFNFGNTKQWSDDTKTFIKSVVEILSLKELSPINNIDTFKNRILKLTSKLKLWGNPEDRTFADYIQSLVTDFNKMTVGDVYDIYKLTDKQTKILIWKYVAAIIVPIAETAYPFIVYAVTEATIGAALPMISRIPLAAVVRGAKLNNMVRQLAKLGKAGTSSRIRLIPNGSYEKSLALFNKITKNSISPVTTTTTANGRIIKVADMGNGNYITFRNFDNTGTTNLVANIDLKFPSIWTKTRELKFIR
ncbi:hypothetical protein, partial [Polaribacter sp.]|uniref:hypothetical protein n=1 Tax=Polaribacter sp. TaxID=1920175 RepID=UPI003F6B9776